MHNRGAYLDGGNILEPVAAIMLFTVVASPPQDNIAERPEHQIPTRLQRALPQHLVNVAVISPNPAILGDRKRFLFLVLCLHHHLHALHMNGFLAHVHQQAEGIRILVLGVVDNQIGTVITLILKKEQLEIDHPDEGHHSAADGSDIIHFDLLF